MCMHSVHGSWKRALDHLKRRLQESVSYAWVLETKQQEFLTTESFLQPPGFLLIKTIIVPFKFPHLLDASSVGTGCKHTGFL